MSINVENSANKSGARNTSNYLAKIMVVGVGGGGVNAVNHMSDAGLTGVELIALNTDMQHLMLAEADVKLDIGRDLTNGLGAGGRPEIGREAAEESAGEIEDMLRGAKMVFITTGEGGGTGTGATPVVARIAKQLGCLTVAVVTKPFAYEGTRKMEQALAGIEELKEYVDCLVAIPNEKLRHLGNKDFKFSKAMELSDETLHDNIRAITEIITKPGYIDVDFADVDRAMRNAGTAIVGIGQAKGEDRMIKAAEQAISSPLFENKIDGAKHIVFCVFGAEDSLDLDELNESATMITEAASPDAFIKNGVFFDDTLEDEVRVIVIATGFEDKTPTSVEEVKLAAKAVKPEEVKVLDDDSADDFKGVSESIPVTSDSFSQFNSKSTSSASIPAVSADNLSVFSSDKNKTVGPTSGSISSISGIDIPTQKIPEIKPEEASDNPLELPSFLND